MLLFLRIFSSVDRLLEDLQETVIPTDSRSRNAQEYREYRLTQRTQVNDEAPQTVDEKWVEIGNLVGGGPVTSGSITDSAYGTTSPSRFTESKSVAFADEQHTSTRLPQRTPNIEYLAPANLTTELSRIQNHELLFTKCFFTFCIFKQFSSYQDRGPARQLATQAALSRRVHRGLQKWSGRSSTRRLLTPQ